MKISNILATKGANIVTVRPDQTIKEAVALLASHKIGALVVTDDSGRLIGILSERDIIRGIAENDVLLMLPVSKMMTRSVITASPHEDLKSVLQTMTDRRFRHLPVMDQGRLAGIISIGDVIKALLEAYEGEIDTLQTQIIQG